MKETTKSRNNYKQQKEFYGTWNLEFIEKQTNKKAVPELEWVSLEVNFRTIINILTDVNDIQFLWPPGGVLK